MKKTIVLLFLLSIQLTANAQMSSFKDGPIIKGFGKHSPVESAAVNKDTKLKVTFDVAAPAESGKINRRFDSLARFINMNVAAGVLKENIELALVVHGKASFDLLNNEHYQKTNKMDNANLPLINLLLAHNVRVILCGQSAAAYKISKQQLIKGTEVELSAMTAHALLQQQGYTVNPF